MCICRRRIIMKKKLPIGIEDFKEIIEKDCYYVDKTLFIKELLDNSSKVRLFTRPRRFGKTLALSMLRYYFEKEMSETAVWRIYAYVCHRICLFIRIFKRTGKKLIYGKHINKTL